MPLSRREFFKVATAGPASLFAAPALLPCIPLQAGPANGVSIATGLRTPTICPFCGCGCGFVVTAENGRVVNVEGDSDHPINRGAACSKGAAIAQIANNPRRLTTPLHRASGAPEWEPVSWEWTIDRIARRMKATRDSNWRRFDDSGQTVNRTEAIACLGGAALDNEECYLLSKAMRSFGLVYLEHQARL